MLLQAGFELEYEDERDTSTSHCEFTATYSPTGEKYSVEAKSRETKPGGSSRTPVGQQLGKALSKKADHRRLVFLDLKKSLHTPEAADRASDRAEYIIRQSENMEIDGQPAPPAYVCITNMNDQYALDARALATMISFVGFKVQDFMGEFPSVLEAVRARERHWPMHQLFKSMQDHREIPQTFDGELPSQVFAANPLPRLQVGKFYSLPGPDGREMTGELTHGTVSGHKAHCALYDPATNESWMGTFDLTPEEVADYAKYPDTFFGVYQKQAGRVETLIELFDFFFDSYRHTPKEKLVELLGGESDGTLASVPQKGLAEILCERFVNNMVAQGFEPQPRNRRRGRSS